MENQTINFLGKARITKKVSDPCTTEEMKEMIENYRNNQLAHLNGKGFYLDHKVVNMIQHFNGENGSPKIGSLYIYLAKRLTNNTPRNDGSYTLIVVPGIKINDNEEVLKLDNGFEWHDTIEQHKPTNEDVIID